MQECIIVNQSMRSKIMPKCRNDDMSMERSDGACADHNASIGSSNSMNVQLHRFENDIYPRHESRNQSNVMLDTK